MQDEAAEWRLKLMESVAENDEELIEVFLETGESVSYTHLRAHETASHLVGSVRCV